MMKNWLPFVFGPLLAMAIEPMRYSPGFGQFVVELVAGSTGAGAGRVAALDDEARG